MRLLATFLVTTLLLADGNGKLLSKHSDSDVPLNVDPESSFWSGAPSVIADSGPKGTPEAGYRTEIRSRWTDKDLYLLYTCPYQVLNLHPNPSTTTETNQLWNWDVAEAFIGADFNHIRQYKEFQVSPQGEWVDLEIDRDHPKSGGGASWNSGYQVMAKIDQDKKIWYGAMKIPFAALGVDKPAAGTEMRINLFRIQGPKPDQVFIAWQRTDSASFHVPEAFGRIALTK
jgi:hypothetical protein